MPPPGDVLTSVRRVLYSTRSRLRTHHEQRRICSMMRPEAGRANVKDA